MTLEIWDFLAEVYGAMQLFSPQFIYLGWLLLFFLVGKKKKKERVIFLAHEPVILWYSSYHKIEFQMDNVNFL